MKEYGMTSIAPTVSKLLGIRPPKQNTGSVITEIVDDMGHQDKVAVLVLDAFGVSTWKRVQALTPNFNKLADSRLLHIRSVMPAITPVNFSTMMTGAPSDVHVIRDRSEMLTIETLFHVLAESSMKSAAAGRAKSTVGMLLMRFAEIKCVAASDTDEEVTRLAVKTIKDECPPFFLIHLLDVDDTGHRSGVEGNEMEKAAEAADYHLGEVILQLAESGYGLLVLADHGAHQIGDKGTHDGSTQDDLIVPLVWGNNHRLSEIA